MNFKKEKMYFNIIIISIIILAVIILFKYKCLFKFIFGIPCPLCGLTRALFYASQFKFKKSFYYHIAWPIVIIIIAIHVLSEFKVIIINKKKFRVILIIFSILNLIYYFYRLFNGSNIVKINFEESLIYKLYSIIFN